MERLDQVEVVGGKLHATPKPEGLHTYFTGVGDDDTLGAGEGSTELIFNMTATDSVRYKEITFLESVHVKDGFVVHRSAPLGSTVSATIHHPSTGAILGAMVRRAHMLGDGWQTFDTDDSRELPAGCKLRITVRNADGESDDHDAPADFKVTARVEMYRITTAGVPSS